LTPSH
jgi:hypothetical protein